jgi:hypothetical protein
MQPKSDRARGEAAIVIILLPLALLLVAACAGEATGPDRAVDLVPFQELARAAECADIHNRLFLIDEQWVFWDRAGDCPDASYSQTLYGGTPDHVLCTVYDSIAGPEKDCPDLGLGPEHTVEPVSH